MGSIKSIDKDGNVIFLASDKDGIASSSTDPVMPITAHELRINGEPISSTNPLPMISMGVTGNVVGPATSTTNALVVYEDITGKKIKNSSILLDDSGNLKELRFANDFIQTTPNVVTNLSGTINDYPVSPGLNLRINAASNITLTGIANGVDGKLLIITNISSNSTITIANSSTSSQAVNRISVPSNGIVLAPGASIVLVYDVSATNWKVLTATYSACDLTFSRNITFGRYLSLVADTGTVIASDQNNYTQSTAPYWRISSDSLKTITGIGNVTAGAIRILHNVGLNPIVLTHLSASSLVANQFQFVDGKDFTLSSGENILLLYDGVISKWRPFYQNRDIGVYTVATLPPASNATKGRKAFASNGLKNGESTGAGTGVPVYDNGNAWYKFDDTVVQA